MLTILRMPELCAPAGKRHLVSLSCDDGFRDSCIRIAEIHERHGLKACLNVLAADDGSFGGGPDDRQRGTVKGDFALWRQLAQRGHEIMPHGWNHTNKASVLLATAQSLITRCLAAFTRELPGFQAKDSVFNFPYNASTPALESWLATQVRACRGAGDGFNPLPSRTVIRVTCASAGPSGIEPHLEGLIARLLAQPQGWLVYNLHGLDAEGWGPVPALWLDGLLGRLTRIPSVQVQPVASLLHAADAA